MGEGVKNPLAGRRVVVTRAVEQSESLVRELGAMGAVPVLAPMVAFGPPDDLGALDAAIRAAARWDWVLFTSQNAVRALQERAESAGIDLGSSFSKLCVAAVGPGTSNAVQNAGMDVTYVAQTHRGTELANELRDKLSGKRVFLPRSDRANPELVGKLKEFGAEVCDLVAYKTVRPDDVAMNGVRSALEGTVDAILFFSPSAVHHLRGVLGREKFEGLSRSAVYAAIGPVTEKALRAARVERIVLAADTTVSAVLVALTDYFMQNGKNIPAGAKVE